MVQPKWAQLHAEYECPLRRGAWYRVLNASSLEVVVEVNRKEVRVPRRYLQFADQPAQMWAVVERAESSGRGPRSLGSRYAVCPSCRERVPLAGRPANMRCPRCNGLFAISGTGTERKEAATESTPAVEPRRRVSMPTIPRHRGPDRRVTERRQEDTPVMEERRTGSERRKGERRKAAARRPPGSTSGDKSSS